MNRVRSFKRSSILSNPSFSPRAGGAALISTLIVTSSVAGLLSGCTSGKEPQANEKSGRSTTKTSGPTIERNGDGTGTLHAEVTDRSAYAMTVGTGSGELLELTAPGSDQRVLVAADRDAVLKDKNGWKVRSLSTDAMFDPDRCSTIAPVRDGASLVFFETIVRPDGDPAKAASPRWYQLSVSDGKTFRRLTPNLSVDERAYPQTLVALGERRVGYLWATESDQAGGDRAQLEGVAARSGQRTDPAGAVGAGMSPMGIGGDGVAVPSGASNVLVSAGASGAGRADTAAMPALHWREIDLRTLQFRDTPIVVPSQEAVRNAYAVHGTIVLQTAGLEPLGFSAATVSSRAKHADAKDLRTYNAERIDLEGLRSSESLTKNERSITRSIDGLSDVRLLSRTKNAALVELVRQHDGQSVRQAAHLDLRAKDVNVAPLRKGARSCVIAGTAS